MTAIEKDDREGPRWVIANPRKLYSKMRPHLKEGEMVVFVGTKSGASCVLAMQPEDKRRFNAALRYKVMTPNNIYEKVTYKLSMADADAELKILTEEFDHLLEKMQNPSFKRKLDVALNSVSSVRLSSD